MGHFDEEITAHCSWGGWLAYRWVAHPTLSLPRRVWSFARWRPVSPSHCQTNCWVLSDAAYGAYELPNSEILVCLPEAARSP